MSYRSSVPTQSAHRSVDVDKVVDGVRAALLANPGVAAAVGTRIGPGVMPPGTAYPYVTLNRATTTYTSPYYEPTINMLVDVAAYDSDPGTDGYATTRVRKLAFDCLTALIDTHWTVPGMTIVSAEMESPQTGFRTLDEVINGVMVRGRQFTVRVQASVPQT